MNPQVEYEMSDEDYATLLDACKPTPCMIGSYIPPTPQENANRAWASLGKKMGFDAMTVRPSNKGSRFFTAVPSETEAQCAERLGREARALRAVEIDKLHATIDEAERRLTILEKEKEADHV